MSDLPDGPVHITYAFNTFAYLAVLMGLVSLGLTAWSLCLRQGCIRASAFAFTFSLLPLMLGGFGTLWDMMRVFGDCARSNTANVQDLCGGLHISLFAVLIGTLSSAPLIFLNLIAIARRLPTCAERKREDA